MLFSCRISSLDDGWHLFWLFFLFVRICIERAGIQMTGRTNETTYDMEWMGGHGMTRLELEVGGIMKQTIFELLIIRLTSSADI